MQCDTHRSTSGGTRMMCGEHAQLHVMPQSQHISQPTEQSHLQCLCVGVDGSWRSAMKSELVTV